MSQIKIKQVESLENSLTTIEDTVVMQEDTGTNSTVRRGNNNCASGYFSTISGGSCNTASYYHSTIGGGLNNTSSGYSSIVSGGQSNTASSYNSTVGGGQSNTASGMNSTVGGGCYNITNARHSIIVGGHRNIIQSPTNECCSRGVTIGGGIGHNTSGGTLNTTTGDLIGTIACCDAGLFSTISGGLRNCGTGACSTVGGGFGNTTSGGGSTITGGQNNIASGYNSGILGGISNNTCGYANSFIVGSNLCATKACTTFMNCATIAGSLGIGTNSPACCLHTTSTPRFDSNNSFAQYTTPSGRGGIDDLITGTGNTYIALGEPSNWLEVNMCGNNYCVPLFRV